MCGRGVWVCGFACMLVYLYWVRVYWRGCDNVRTGLPFPIWTFRLPTRTLRVPFFITHTPTPTPIDGGIFVQADKQKMAGKWLGFRDLVKGIFTTLWNTTTTTTTTSTKLSSWGHTEVMHAAFPAKEYQLPPPPSTTATTTQQQQQQTRSKSTFLNSPQIHHNRYHFGTHDCYIDLQRGISKEAKAQSIFYHRHKHQSTHFSAGTLFTVCLVGFFASAFLNPPEL